MVMTLFYLYYGSVVCIDAEHYSIKQLNYFADESTLTAKGAELACAVCAQCNVGANSSTQVEFCLTWDMPEIQFGAKENVYRR